MVRIIRHNLLAAAYRQPGDESLGRAVPDVPELSIIVVSYNTREMTIDCLRSVIEQTREVSYEILVVDNASSDGSAAAIAALGGPIRLFALADNLGFARANNLASREARGSHLLLLNPDTLVLDGAIDRLFRFARANPLAGIWGGRNLTGDRRLDRTCVWGRMTLWSVLCRSLGLTEVLAGSPTFNPEEYGAWQRDSVREVDIVTGCFLMIRRQLWESLGGFDRVFFMYGEEADLCLRARGLGARPLFTPEAVIVHYGGASEATHVGKIIKLLRAKVTLARRHWDPTSAAIGRSLLALWPLTRWLGLGLAGWLLGRPHLQQRAAVWHDVWRRRAEWLGGYEVEPAAGVAGLLGQPAAGQ